MELDSCLASLVLLFVLAINGSVCETPVTENDDLHNTLVQKMRNIQKQLAEVTKSMNSLNADIGNVLCPRNFKKKTALKLTGDVKGIVDTNRRFSCSAEQNFICDAFKTNNGLGQEKGQYFPLGTQKRSAGSQPSFARHRRFYRDLLRKRAMTNHLLSVLKDADGVLKHETKRTCEVNLGFHCETEELSEFADIYDFLASEHSPGKKRASMALP